MTEIIGGILAGPEVDDYHELGKEFTTPQKEAEYVKELTKLLTGIVTKNNQSLTTYLDDAKDNITSELGGINDEDQVVAKLASKIDLSSPLSTLLLEKFPVTTTTAEPSKAANSSKALIENTGNPPTSVTAGGNSTGFEASGGFRKTNKRRNNKGRKRSKGTRKK